MISLQKVLSMVGFRGVKVGVQSINSQPGVGIVVVGVSDNRGP